MPGTVLDAGHWFSVRDDFVPQGISNNVRRHWFSHLGGAGESDGGAIVI